MNNHRMVASMGTPSVVKNGVKEIYTSNEVKYFYQSQSGFSSAKSNKKKSATKNRDSALNRSQNITQSNPNRNLSQFIKVKNYNDNNYDSDHMPPSSHNSNVLMVDAGVRVTLDYDIKKQMHQPVLKQHQTKKTKLVHLG